MNKNRFNLIIALSLLLIIILSFQYSTNAQSGVKGNEAQSQLTIKYPYEGTIFPPEIATPTFFWNDNDKKTDKWIISIYINGQQFGATTTEQKWKPARKEWEKIKSISYDKKVDFSVTSVKDGKSISSANISFSVSKDSVNAPIFYRDVPLPFSHALANLKTIRWRIGDISSDSIAPIAMENLYVCANCHSLSANGRTLGMDVDAHSDKDAYGITDIAKETILYKMLHWSKGQNGLPTYGLLSSVSPKANYLASTIGDHEFFVTRPDTAYSQLFFPIKGVICICDRHKDTYSILPGADDTNYVQTNPVWSPDSKYIYFAYSKAIDSKESGFITSFNKDTAVYNRFVEPFIEGKRDYKYDIYRIPFNDGKGGKAEPIEGASKNGMSNYFPKISPDGKWMVYCRAKNFMLLQPDSKLYILPASGGSPRLMNCNLSNLNSWHSWSPNGKWLVFSSKERGKYTKLYLTHIDEFGNDSPPVLLENLGMEGRACNIPEFVNIKPGEFKKILPKFLEDDYFLYQNGVEKIEHGDLKGALMDFSKAIITDSNNYKLYGSRGYVYMELGDAKNALEDFNRGLRIKPNDYKLYNLRGFALLEFGDSTGALDDFNESIRLNQVEPETYNSRGYVLVGLGKYKEAISDFNKALKLKPDYLEALYERGLAYFYLDEYQKAISDFNKALKLRDNFLHAFYHRGLAKSKAGLKAEACNDLQRAAELGLEDARLEMEKNCK